MKLRELKIDDGVGRKDNAEAQRTRSFAEQEHEMRLPRGARISLRYGKAIGMWAGDTLDCPFMRREVEMRPGFYRGPARQ